ncbi:MAG TPA: sulfatase [Solirubrobacterales bacterium]|nr:sulfatase [Solirubrobacterales bacterium]
MSHARRRVPLLVGLAVLLAAVAAPPLATDDRASAAPGGPNIIVVITDDQDARLMWPMKQTLKRLAGYGVTFRNSFATNPVCCPSRATFLTGQYSHNHGVLTNAPPDGGLGMFHPLEDKTIAVALRNAGYTTAFVGKYLNGYPTVAAQDPQFRPPGWDRWLAMSRVGLYNWVLNRNGTEKPFGSLKRHYNTDVLARLSKRFIANSSGGDAPFFLTVMTLSPHGERGLKFAAVNPRPAQRHSKMFPKLKLPRPPSFNRAATGKPEFLQRPPITKQLRKRLRAKHQGRARSLVAVDELVSGIIDQLRASDQLANTYLIFTSDNGFMLGEHRLTLKSLPYEESARVPLIVRGPDLPKGIEVEAPVGNIDLAPTILDVAGASPLLNPDGVSLLDVIDDPDAWAGRDVLLEKFNYGDLDAEGAALRNSRFAYVRQVIEGEPFEELYDMDPESETYDPFQLENRADDPELAAEKLVLEARLAQLRDCKGTGPPNPCD